MLGLSVFAKNLVGCSISVALETVIVIDHPEKQWDDHMIEHPSFLVTNCGLSTIKPLETVVGMTNLQGQAAQLTCFVTAEWDVVILDEFHGVGVITPSKRTDITVILEVGNLSFGGYCSSFLQKSRGWVVTIVPNWVYQKFPSFDRPHLSRAERYLLYLNFHEFFWISWGGETNHIQCLCIFYLFLVATDSKKIWR